MIDIEGIRNNLEHKLMICQTPNKNEDNAIYWAQRILQFLADEGLGFEELIHAGLTTETDQSNLYAKFIPLKELLK